MLILNKNILTIGGNRLEGGPLTPPEPPVDPYNPLGLPDNTIRVKFSSGYTPDMGNSQTLVDSTNNVWDIYKRSNNWYELFKNNRNVLEVLGANTTNVTDMFSMFHGCSSLTSVALFDTSNVTDMNGMLKICETLTSVPLFNTSNVTDMSYMFEACYNVESGALALYQQASSQTNPPADHSDTFRWCGALTTTGSAELAQIPSSWGGKGA